MINLVDLLYKGNNRKKIRITEEECSVNTFYQLKTEAGEKKVKFNALALALDLMLVDRKVQVYTSKLNATLVKYEIDGKESMALINEAIYTFLDLEDKNLNILVPVAANLIVNDLNIRYTFRKLKEAEELDEKKNLVAKFCDDAYYALKNSDNGLTIDETDGLSQDFAVSAISKGTFSLFEDIKADERSETADTEKATDFTSDFTVDYGEWSEEQKRNIPHGELSTYVMTPQAESIARKIKFRMDKVTANLSNGKEGLEAIGSNYINLLLVGEPGTGKTKMSYAIAEMVNMPIYTIPISKNTEEDTFEGKNKVINGQISFAETDFIKAYEHGGIIVLEEINLADPAVIMGALGQAIEAPFIVMKDGYIPIRRHPMCIVIATMNTGTSGSKTLNQALSSRFKQSYILADQEKSVFIQILKTRYNDAKTCRWVENAYRKIKNYLSSSEVNREDLCQNLSMRACFGALENIEEGEDRKTAIRNTIVGKIAETDLEIARIVSERVVNALPDR